MDHKGFGIDDALGRLEELATLTDEQLMEKYADCFKFESDYLANIQASSSSITKTQADNDEVAEATKRLLEKKKSKKKQAEEELKRMLLEDAELLKEP